MASTPSNAAELAVNDINEDKRRAESLFDRLERGLSDVIDKKQTDFERLINSRGMRQPLTTILQKEGYVKALAEKMSKSTENKIRNDSLVLSKAASTLEALSPLKVLSRGYSYTEDSRGKVVSSADGIQSGDRLYVTFLDGRVSVTADDRVMFDGEEK